MAFKILSYYIHVTVICSMASNSMKMSHGKTIGTIHFAAVKKVAIDNMKT